MGDDQFITFWRVLTAACVVFTAALAVHSRMVRQRALFYRDFVFGSVFVTVFVGVYHVIGISFGSMVYNRALPLNASIEIAMTLVLIAMCIAHLVLYHSHSATARAAVRWGTTHGIMSCLITASGGDVPEEMLKQWQSIIYAEAEKMAQTRNESVADVYAGAWDVFLRGVIARCNAT